MFTYSTTIRLKDTDATGVIYFAQMPSLALEALEEAIHKAGFSLKQILHSKEFLLPVVHMEADYYAPLTVGDSVEIQMSVSHIGQTSFTLSYRLIKKEDEIEAGRVSIVHVAISKKTKKSIPIPEGFGKFLEKMQK